MPRAPRSAPPGAIHHVTNRGNRRRVIFRKPADYRAFLRVLAMASRRFEVRLIGFCLMPNHWHLIVWPPEHVSISAYMHWLTSTHVRRYHEHYSLVGTGHLYQGRFGNRVFLDERRLLTALRYVEANPLRARLVERAELWEWSSLPLRLGGDKGALLCECPVALPANWAQVINESTPAGLRAPQSTSRK